MVAPLAGAWIEIVIKDVEGISAVSHPSRVRGLKFMEGVLDSTIYSVAPLAGAWIEIDLTIFSFGSEISRTPRGCVD